MTDGELGKSRVPPLETLAQAEQIVARQAAELARLQRRLADERFAEELRQALTLAAVAGTIAAPMSHGRLLEMIVMTAAHVISSQAAALFLIDPNTEELVFEVALGQQAADVKKFRVPLGQGIAGLVAVTGQPMAVTDAHDDPRQAADIAQAVRYVPKTILCVPLVYNDQVIGVLELLDKKSGESFDPTDIETLGLFANQAAVAIEQSRTHRNLATLISNVLDSFATRPEEQRTTLKSGAYDFARHMQEDDVTYKQALDLAQLVQSITQQGEREYSTCRILLQGFADYLRAQVQDTQQLGVFG